MNRAALIFSMILVLGFAATLVVSAIPIPDNHTVTGHLPGLQNEEQVFFCPSDPNIIITNHRDFRLGYRQIGIGRGILGGLFWIDSLIHPDYQIFTRQSDPVMTVNSAGDVIICHLDYIGGLGYDDSSHLAFLVSSDCGESWNGPYTVSDTIGPYFEDKQFITADRTGGPYDGNVYISWTRFPNPDRIVFARSTDGTQTFEDTIIVGPNHTSTCYGGPYDAGQFSQPLVGKDGAVYVFWQGHHIDSATCNYYTSIRLNKSTDGGVTWQGGRAIVWPVDGYNDVDGNVDVYSQPTTDADITDGPHAGNLYLQYRNANPDSPYDSDIMFQRSLDTGHTWSEPIRVNDDPVGPDVDQFHNWMVCNEEGILFSIWYDQREDPSHYTFDVFAGYSFDGGATWTSNHRISSVPISPDYLLHSADGPGENEPTPEMASPMAPLMPMAGKIAEYIGLTALRDSICAVWTDTRFGDQDVMSATWELPLTDPRLIYPLAGETVPYDDPGLLWATAWKETEDQYQLQIATDAGFTSIVYDVTVSSNEYHVPLTALSFGLYYWRIKAHRAPGGTPIESTAFSDPGSFYLMDNGIIVASLSSDPDCEYHSDQSQPVESTTLTVQNYGTGDLTYEAQVVYLSGSGWLTIEGSQTIPSTTIVNGGPNETYGVFMDGSSLANGLYQARIEFTHDGVGANPYRLLVNFFRAETFICSDVQLMTTPCVALEVSNVTSVGRMTDYAGMWHYAASPPDNEYSPLYDASLLIADKTLASTGSDTMVYRDIFANQSPSNPGFMGGDSLTISYDAAKNDSVVSTRAVTVDSAFAVDIQYLFPQESENCEFVRIKYRIYDINGSATDAILGFAADFDNGDPVNDLSGYYANYNLLYQHGTTSGVTNRYVSGLTYLSCNPVQRLITGSVWDITPTIGFPDQFLYEQMDQIGHEMYSGGPEDLYSIMVMDEVSLVPEIPSIHQIAIVTSTAGGEGYTENDLTTDETDLLATTAKAWKKGFGWCGDFWMTGGMLILENGTGSIGFHATGTHEDGLSGGCCGCVFSYEIDPVPAEGTVVLTSSGCDGSLDLDGVGIGVYTITLTVEDLCAEQSDQIMFVVDVTSVDFCGEPYGDVNCDNALNPVDVVYMVNYVYKDQDARCYPWNWSCPYDLGDVDCSGGINPVDVVYYVNKVYKNMDAFCNPYGE